MNGTVFYASRNDRLPAPESTDRRFFALDPFSRQEAAVWLAARQRENAPRIRLCSTGCYTLYSDQGQFIGRTPPRDGEIGLNVGQLRTSAARMAYAEELHAICRVADLDYEQSGTVAPSTIVAIRQLLSDIGAA